MVSIIRRSRELIPKAGGLGSHRSTVNSNTGVDQNCAQSNPSRSSSSLFLHLKGLAASRSHFKSKTSTVGKTTTVKDNEQSSKSSNSIIVNAGGFGSSFAGSKSSSNESLSYVADSFDWVEGDVSSKKLIQKSGSLGTKSTLLHASLFEKNGLSFLICQFPCEDLVDAYAEQLHAYGVEHIVRVCERTSVGDRVAKKGFSVHDLEFDDGEVPSSDIIDNWLDVVESVFLDSKEEGSNREKKTIAIHCPKLGRPLLLVVLALAQVGLSPWDAIAYIRAKSRGAINQRQRAFVTAFQPRIRSSKDKPSRSRFNVAIRNTKTSRPFPVLSTIKSSRPFRWSPKSTPKTSPNTSAVLTGA